jgi:hypothetical protein
MAASYKMHSRSPIVKLIKEGSGARGLAETARAYFEARDVMLDVDKFFDE